MKIILCIKPIKSELVFPGEDRNEKFVLNPYDYMALTMCLNLKKNVPGCQIVCVCMGTLESKEVLTYALALGADDAVLISDSVFAGSDTVATSYILAKAISSIGNADLIVCGERSVDGETGQVAYGIAERLDFGCVNNISEFVSFSEKSIECVRKADNMTCLIKVPLQSVVISCGCKTEYETASLLARKRAKQKQISLLTHIDLGITKEQCGLLGSKTKVLKSSKIQISVQSEFINGTPTEQAYSLINCLGITL
ncbi:MAG: electron transfer flavoprotein subunit beta/FixA family protein [Acutalibacteraceae bacterium]|nr:electron transfer flavoprotein subunit beta/FixA family protein [Acutalibacteraceae bacterium]